METTEMPVTAAEGKGLIMLLGKGKLPRRNFSADSPYLLCNAVWIKNLP